MNYHIYENTRYDREKQQSVPYSYSLTWGVYTNSPNRNGQAKIAGQDRKVFSDKAAMEKYLNGRIKAYVRLFTEISPPIPQEYAEHFKVNGMLLPGYTIAVSYTHLDVYKRQVNGSLNIFNHRTNVDIHNRLVCFDIKELGTQLKKVGMLIVQDQVWNRVTVNRSCLLYTSRCV